MPILPELFHSHGGNSSSPIRQWSSLIGILTAIIGNILISFALNTQRYAHIRIDREYKNRQDPEANQARKKLPKSLRNYGTAIQQEEIAEERARINENAPHPNDEAQHVQNGIETNGKRHLLRSNGTGQNHTESGDNDDGGNDEGAHEEHGRKSYLTSPWWWLGITLMTIGEAGNFLAYAFAPASIVSPLGVVALISNCLIAPLMLKERFRQRDFWGVMIAIGGAVTVVFSAKTQEKQLGPDELLEDIKRWEFLVYVLITAVFIAALMFASPKYGQRTILIDLGLVGLFGGYTVLSTKGVASLLSTSLYRAFTYPIFYFLVLVLVLSAILQIRYLNRGLQNFDSTQVIPVQFVLFTLSVIIGSAVLYRDFERTDVDHVLKFVFGCLLTFSGVYFITSGRKKEDDNDDESSTDDGERIRLLDEEGTEEPASLIKHEHEQMPTVETWQPQLDGPKTPKRDLSPSSSNIPSISVTPAASTDHLEVNPWASSSKVSLDQTTNEDRSSPVVRPHTPVNQTIPSASSSTAETPQTAFYTPNTTSRPLPQRQRLSRTSSSPAQPETPTRRAPSPPKPSPLVVEGISGTSAIPLLRPGQHSQRRSISRLLPGPILQPLSSSLSGIVADRIRRGEGTGSPSPRSSLRRNRSNREARRVDDNTPTSSTLVLQRAQTHQSEQSPLLSRAQQQYANNSEDASLLSGNDSLVRPKGRLRSMSESLANFVGRATGRRSSKDDEDDGRDTTGGRTAQAGER